MNLGLYIHIPFCKQKCLYCDFLSMANCSESLISQYVSSLKAEIDMYSKIYSNYNIDTIFIGGGTPTYISCEFIKEILDTIYNKFNVLRNCEISCEANPGTLDIKKLNLLKKAGINRLSLGLQTTSNDLLKKIGRIHSYEEFLENYILAREAGFNNINIDLMFGLPNQTFFNFEETLLKVTALKPEHMSIYSLIIEEGTPFFDMYQKGKIELPDEDEERKMYHYLLKFLNANGYFQYEISNYSKPGFECKHNLRYWNCDEYLGLGVSAHSFINNKRWENTRDIDFYISEINRCINSENKPKIITSITSIELNDRICEFMFMNLRKISGVSFEEFQKRFSLEINEIYNKQISKFIELELLTIENEHLKLTAKGIEFSNTVMAEFIL